MKKPIPVESIVIKEPTRIAGTMVHDPMGPADLARREMKAWIVPGGIFVRRGQDWSVLSWSQVQGVGGTGDLAPEDLCERGPGRPKKDA